MLNSKVFSLFLLYALNCNFVLCPRKQPDAPASSSAAPAPQASEEDGTFDLAQNLQRFVAKYGCQYVEEYLRRLDCNPFTPNPLGFSYRSDGVIVENIPCNDASFAYRTSTDELSIMIKTQPQPIDRNAVYRTITTLLRNGVDQTTPDVKIQACSDIGACMYRITRATNTVVIAGIPTVHYLQRQVCYELHVYMLARHEGQLSNVVKLARHDNRLEITHELMPTSHSCFIIPVGRAQDDNSAEQETKAKQEETRQTLYNALLQDNTKQDMRAHETSTWAKDLAGLATQNKLPELAKRAEALGTDAEAELTALAMLKDKIEEANRIPDPLARTAALTTHADYAKGIIPLAIQKRLDQMDADLGEISNLINEELDRPRKERELAEQQKKARQKLAKQAKQAEKAMMQLLAEEDAKHSKAKKKASQNKDLQASTIAQTTPAAQTHVATQDTGATKVAGKKASKKQKGGRAVVQSTLADATIPESNLAITPDATAELLAKLQEAERARAEAETKATAEAEARKQAEAKAREAEIRAQAAEIYTTSAHTVAQQAQRKAKRCQSRIAKTQAEVARLEREKREMEDAARAAKANARARREAKEQIERERAEQDAAKAGELEAQIRDHDARVRALEVQIKKDEDATGQIQLQDRVKMALAEATARKTIAALEAVKAERDVAIAELDVIRAELVETKAHLDIYKTDDEMSS